MYVTFCAVALIFDEDAGVIVQNPFAPILLPCWLAQDRHLFSIRVFKTGLVTQR